MSRYLPIRVPVHMWLDFGGGSLWVVDWNVRAAGDGR